MGAGASFDDLNEEQKQDYEKLSEQGLSEAEIKSYFLERWPSLASSIKPALAPRQARQTMTGALCKLSVL